MNSLQKTQTNSVFLVEGVWRSHRIHPSHIHLVADDCINRVWVNNQEVSLERIQENKCDIMRGSVIDLKGFLHPGENNIRAEIIDHGGNRAVYFKIPIADAISWIFLLSICALALLIFSILFGNISCAEWSVFALGATARIFYFPAATYPPKIYDIDGHIDYIRTLSQTLVPPNAAQCWECYQPSGYYYFASPIYKIASQLTYDIYTPLQLLSLILFLGMLYLFVRAASFWIEDRKTLLIVSALFVFWPVGIRDSARIGNDLLFYFMSAMTMFFVSKWIKEKTSQALGAALLSGALGWISKFNIIAFNAAGMLFLLLRKEPLKFIFKKPVFMLLLFLNFLIPAASLFQSSAEKGDLSWIHNADRLENSLKMNVTASSFFCFDAKTFLTHPSSSAYDDSGGRQCFWNFMLKTSLFYNCALNSPAHLKLDLVLSWLLLILAFILFAQFINFAVSRRFYIDDTYLWLSLCLPIAALMFNLLKYPYACSQDFRYILPILFPAIILLSRVRLARWIMPLIVVCSIYGIFWAN